MSGATYQLHHGDCLEVLRTLPDNSVDAVVTDPLTLATQSTMFLSEKSAKTKPPGIPRKNPLKTCGISSDG